MKKIISVMAVAAIALAFPFIAQAQLEKGKFTIGESVGFFKNSSSNSLNNDHGKFKNKQSFVDFTNILSLGYLLSSRFEIGVENKLEIDRSKSEWNSSYSSEDQKNKSFHKSFGIYVRFYQPIVDRFNFFAHLNASYTFGRSTYESHEYGDTGELTIFSEYESKLKSFSTGLRPGVNFMVSNKFGLEFSMGEILFSKYLKDDTRTNSDFRMNFNMANITLGGRLYL